MSRLNENSDSETRLSATETGFRHLAPRHQPQSVHEISDSLYAPFRDSELSVHLSGCNIDPIPFVKAESGEYRLLNGETMSPEFAESLGLDQLDELPEPPVEWQAEETREKILEQLDALKLEIALASAADGQQWIVWCNHVHGRLTAETEEAMVDIPFSLWGVRLVSGTELCPPYHCPFADVDTWNLAADDEGTISDANSMEICSETGKRLLRQKMETCHASGKLVDRSILMQCPVSGRFLLSQLAGQCVECHQTVEPSTLGRGRCDRCRNLQKVNRDHGFLQELFGHFDGLQRARKFKMAEQPDSWLVQAAIDGQTWRMVIGKQTLSVLTVARLNGWLRGWSRVDEGDWPDFLKSR